MKGILLQFFQVFNTSAGRSQNDPGEPQTAPAWLNAKKQQLFLNAEEIWFGEDWVKLLEGEAEVYIDWQEMEFFHYPFVGVNVKLPGFTGSRYFSLIVREEMEDHPLLSEFTGRLEEQVKIHRPFAICS